MGYTKRVEINQQTMEHTTFSDLVQVNDTIVIQGRTFKCFERWEFEKVVTLHLTEKVKGGVATYNKTVKKTVRSDAPQTPEPTPEVVATPPKTGQVKETNKVGVFDVESTTTKGTWYVVDTVKNTCTCLAGSYGKHCKHLDIARSYIRTQNSKARLLGNSSASLLSVSTLKKAYSHLTKAQKRKRASIA